MEALVQILLAVVAFILEVTLHAIVFVFYLLMAIFSKRYREKLRNDWATSPSKRFGIVICATFYSAALIFALLFWLPVLLNGTPEVIDKDNKSSVNFDFSNEELQRMKNTKEIKDLVDVAGGIVKRKLEERGEEEKLEAPSGSQTVQPNSDQ
jgi:TRAP-type C4-dicarboxylate transport system permease small subunit